MLFLGSTLLFSPVLTLADVAARGPLAPHATCKRDLTQISDVVQTAFTGKAEVAYTMSGASIAWGVCTAINHNAGTEQPCTAYAAILAGVLISIFEIQMLPNTSSEGTTSSQIDAGGIFTAHLGMQGFVWEQLEPLTVQRSYNNPEAVDQHFVIRGISHRSVPVTPADLHYTLYKNGTGYVNTIHSRANHAGLGKRGSSAGFKYSWLTEVWNANDPAATNNSDFHIVATTLGKDIANNWAHAADNDKLDEWIGAVGVDYILAQLLGMAIRIIPKPNGFTDEYEDVNVCGDMYGPIHDELWSEGAIRVGRGGQESQD
ncbi:hypothetical protein C8A03DRAFT_16768 [Achaetomium macrosporum]|uniref:Uncharacterized protein n=1 Tax=Achaetomium macrosporum TaxID=79813 RepID=A0AAN7C765_9PEZI|nr:hypothetical protein C8A03DRAFT_16768 [Achaetomium macrosporum]